MVSNKGFALLIGVDDYASYDPAMSLKGSREDVLKLYWMCLKLLGLSPENVRVLTSPPLTAKDFYATDPPPSDMLGPATKESIQAGVEWLAGRMASDTAAPGLLTYSGHGSYSKDRGPLLCPSDIERDLAKGIAVRDLSKSQALQGVRDRLTVLLDCCHASPVTKPSDFRSPTALPHDATPEQVAADHADFDISERVLLAARPGQHAHQALLGKVWHGALTFALVTVAEQWKASQDPNGSGMHVSYKQLLKRVRRMLWSLRMKQSARLRVPAEKRKAVRALPFFGTHAATTMRRPDAPRDKVQLDPNFYQIKLNYGDPETTIILADVVALGSSNIVVNTPGGSQVTLGTPFYNRECWYVNRAAVALLSEASSISVVTQALPASGSIQLDSGVSGDGGGYPYFAGGESATWSTTVATYSATTLNFQGVTTNGSPTYWLQLAFTTRTLNGATLGDIVGVQWFASGASNIDPSTYQPYSPTKDDPPSSYRAAQSY